MRSSLRLDHVASRAHALQVRRMITAAVDDLDDVVDLDASLAVTVGLQPAGRIPVEDLAAETRVAVCERPAACPLPPTSHRMLRRSGGFATGRQSRNRGVWEPAAG